MQKEFLYESTHIDNPFDLIQRDIAMYGEEYLKSMDDSEFLLNYGMTRQEYLYNFRSEIADYTSNKLEGIRRNVPFTEQSLSNLVEGYKSETVKHLSSVRITSEKSIKKSPSELQLNTRTSASPSSIKRGSFAKQIELMEESDLKSDEAKSPSNDGNNLQTNVIETNTASSNSSNHDSSKLSSDAKSLSNKTQSTTSTATNFALNRAKKKSLNQQTDSISLSSQEKKLMRHGEDRAKKEFLNFKKGLLKNSKGPFAKKTINLLEKALVNALQENGLKWGSEEYNELIEKFFPGANISTPDSSNITEEGQNEAKSYTEPVADYSTPDKDKVKNQVSGTTKENQQTQTQDTYKTVSVANKNTEKEVHSYASEEGSSGSGYTTSQSSKSGTGGSQKGKYQSSGTKTSRKETKSYQKKEISIDAENSADAATSFSNNTSLEHVERLKAVNGKIGELNEKDKTDLEEKMPEVDQPTGIERIDQLPEKEKLKIKEKESSHDFNPNGEEVRTDFDLTHHQPNLDPGELSNKTFISSGEESKEEVMNAVAEIPVTDDNLNTDIGEIPDIPLTGINDPEQITKNKDLANKEALKQFDEANLETLKDFGENDIYPTLETENLEGEIEFTNQNIPGFEVEEIPEDLPQDIGDALNEAIEKDRLELVEPEITKVSAKKDETEQQQQLEIDNSLNEIDNESKKTKELQEKEQLDAKKQVNDYQSDWQKENDQILCDFNTDAEKEQLKAQTDIDKKVAETNKTTNSTLDNANQQIETEKDAAEKKAVDAKEEVSTKKKSWWQKALDAIGNFFDSIKKAVTNIFNALRQKVKEIIEGAKRLINDLIDAASNFIKDTIRLFGEILKAIVSIVLFAFPKLAKKINDLIDKAVELACKAVDLLAEKLKETVNKLLDALGIILDLLLAQLHFMINIALEVYKLFSKFVLMYVQRLVQVVVGIILAAGTLVVLAAIIAGGGIFASLWSMLEDKPELQKIILKYIFDAFEFLLDTIPGDLLGPFSALMVGLLKGFIGKSRAELLESDNAEKGLKVITKLAHIATGEDTDFLWSFLKNIFIGLWENIADIFIGIWDLVKFTIGIPGMIKDVVSTIIDVAPDIAEMLTNLFGNAKIMLEEFMKNGPGFLENLAKNLTPEKIMEFFENMKAKIEAFSYSLGEKIASKFVQFMLSGEATSAIGERLGKLTGMIVFEVLMAVFTAGIGNAAKWGLKAARPLIRIASKIGQKSRLLAKIGRMFINGLKTVFSALKTIVGKLKALTNKGFTAFKNFIDNILAGLSRILAKIGIRVDLDHKKLYKKLQVAKEFIATVKDNIGFVSDLKETVDTSITNKVLDDIQPTLEKYKDKYDIDKLNAAIKKNVKVEISLQQIVDMLNLYSKNLNGGDDSSLRNEIINALINSCLEQIRTGVRKALDEVGVASEDRAKMEQDIIKSATDSFYNGMAEEIIIYVSQFLSDKAIESGASSVGQYLGEKATKSISDSNNESDTNRGNNNSENNSQTNRESSNSSQPNSRSNNNSQSNSRSNNNTQSNNRSNNNSQSNNQSSNNSQSSNESNNSSQSNNQSNNSSQSNNRSNNNSQSNNQSNNNSQSNNRSSNNSQSSNESNNSSQSNNQTNNSSQSNNRSNNNSQSNNQTNNSSQSNRQSNNSSQSNNQSNNSSQSNNRSNNNSQSNNQSNNNSQSNNQSSNNSQSSNESNNSSQSNNQSNNSSQSNNRSNNNSQSNNQSNNNSQSNNQSSNNSQSSNESNNSSQSNNQTNNSSQSNNQSNNESSNSNNSSTKTKDNSKDKTKDKDKTETRPEKEPNNNHSENEDNTYRVNLSKKKKEENDKSNNKIQDDAAENTNNNKLDGENSNKEDSKNKDSESEEERKKSYNTSNTALKPLGRGCTGRTTPRNLVEQMVMKAVLEDPTIGNVVVKSIKDSRWPGWSKLHYSVLSKNGTKAVVHYVGKFENGVLKYVDDFKFKRVAGMK